MPLIQGAERLGAPYDLRGKFHLVKSTGAVTVIAAGTATAGHIFSFRWSSATSARCFLRYVGARFTTTTAYTTPQETGVDMYIARAYTASHSAATAIDLGSTVANTNNLMASLNDSLIVANACRIASTVALTAGTHTLDPNPVGILSAWAGGTIGDTVPLAATPQGGGFGTVWDARAPDADPIVFAQDEGFVLRNTIVMGAVGVGRWDFCVKWDEGTPAT